MARGEDIGHNHFMRYYGWAPDRKLNPQYKGIPDIEKVGVIVEHQRPDNGADCASAVTFDIPEVHRVKGFRGPFWTVVSWEPLTLDPSLLCRACQDHGHIREGLWVPS
jgi:hypothetical protein